MAIIDPVRIEGIWNDGFALDYHRIHSEYLSTNEYGQPQFETTRTELGELLYRLKYKSDVSVVTEIADSAAQFVANWQPDIDAVVPVPPSRERARQPVALIGEALAERLGVEFAVDWVAKIQVTPPLKDMEFSARLELIRGTHSVDSAKVQGKRILLVDDLFQSGATLNALTEALSEHGCSAVFALTVTRAGKRR